MAGPPEAVGTVTVVVTEIEQSASLLERFGEQRFLALLAEY